MLELLNKHHPGHKHKVSKGWLFRWQKRYNVVQRFKTDKKPFSAQERWPLIERFHKDILYTQLTHPQICPVWGAYPPSRIWNADQCPAPFCINLKRSLNPKGEPCWIVHVGPSGLEKRQATIHPCIRADGEQIMPPFIIFRGENQCPTARERDILDSIENIRWAFQPKAVADGKYCRKWMRTFCSIVQKNDPGQHLLFLDDLAAHKRNSCRKIAVENGVLPFPIPPGVTDVCQPVDVGVGKFMKHIMSELYKVELELNIDEWRQYQSNKSLSASNRRILMARWLSVAWKEVMKNNHLTRACFERTVLVRRDGSHNIIVKGVPNIPPISLS